MIVPPGAAIVKVVIPSNNNRKDTYRLVVFHQRPIAEYLKMTIWVVQASNQFLSKNQWYI